MLRGRAMPFLAILSSTLLLSGCVVTPAPPVYPVYRPARVIIVAPVRPVAHIFI
ncbi:MAG: hypothetical protein GY782_07895 [Gammaproteobacteria bacterium]|nr:hypothetical protein [Gammaproteobacteria bacterium]